MSSGKIENCFFWAVSFYMMTVWQITIEEMSPENDRSWCPQIRLTKRNSWQIGTELQLRSCHLFVWPHEHSFGVQCAWLLTWMSHSYSIFIILKLDSISVLLHNQHFFKLLPDIFLHNEIAWPPMTAIDWDWAVVETWLPSRGLPYSWHCL